MVYASGDKWIDTEGREYVCLNMTTISMPKGTAYVQRFHCQETRLMAYQVSGCGQGVVQLVEDTLDAELVEVAMGAVIDKWLEATGQVIQ